MNENETLDGEHFCQEVTKIVNKPSFVNEHTKSRAPLAMLAFATVVVEKIINKKKIHQYFDGMTFQVPPSKEMYSNPHYHSVVGQQLLYVDWIKVCGLAVSCPGCRSALANDRTNFSKNKILFPIFHINGPPSWAIVQSMTCTRCRSRYEANNGRTLVQIPQYTALAYPVESKHALTNKNSHLGRSATDMLDLLMPTYGNGEFCSRLLYNAINRAHLRRVPSYYSYPNLNQKRDYINKNGEYMRAFPPPGDAIFMTKPQTATIHLGQSAIMTGIHGKSNRLSAKGCMPKTTHMR